MARIVVTFDPPPIPLRAFDWIAYEDGNEETQAYGATRVAAAAALAELLDERA